MEQAETKSNKGKIRIPISRNVLIFLVFIVISTFFWFLFVMSRKHVMDVVVNFEYTGIPKSYVLTSNLPKQEIVSVKDMGFNELANFWFSHDERKVAIDLSERFDSISSQFVITQSEIQKALTNILPSSVEIKQFYPREIVVNYDKLYQKKVAVELLSEINLSRQFTLTNNVTFSPDSVNMFGPEDIVTKLDMARTQKIKLNNVDKSQKIKVNLASLPHVTFDPKTVEVTIKVEKFTEKSVTVPVKTLNTANNKRLRTFPSEVTVTFNVGLSHYKKVTADDFEVTADVSAMSDSSHICILRESHKSPFIHSVRITPNNVEYIIEDK